MKLNVRSEDIAFGENIVNVQVPDALKHKIRSNLDYFDCALGGQGFTPSQAALFTGTPGAGKTTMMDVITGKTRPDTGRVVFGNLNIMNKSQKAEEIGRQQLGGKVVFFLNLLSAPSAGPVELEHHRSTALHRFVQVSAVDAVFIGIQAHEPTIHRQPHT